MIESDSSCGRNRHREIHIDRAGADVDLALSLRCDFPLVAQGAQRIAPCSQRSEAILTIGIGEGESGSGIFNGHILERGAIRLSDSATDREGPGSPYADC